MITGQEQLDCLSVYAQALLREEAWYPGVLNSNQLAPGFCESDVAHSFQNVLVGWGGAGRVGLPSLSELKQTFYLYCLKVILVFSNVHGFLKCSPLATTHLSSWLPSTHHPLPPPLLGPTIS